MGRSHQAEMTDTKQRLQALESLNQALQKQVDASTHLLEASATKLEALDSIDQLRSGMHKLQRGLDDQEMTVKHIKTQVLSPLAALLNIPSMVFGPPCSGCLLRCQTLLGGGCGIFTKRRPPAGPGVMSVW
jgi:seryl-tRNA synthetase